MTDFDGMILEGVGGSLRLSFVSYQFPSNYDDEWDSNWLIVAGVASLDGKEWSFQDPCLTTFEAEQLADWLDKTANGVSRDSIGFVEPNLQFDRLSVSSIRVSFALESAPPWARSNDDWDRHGFELPVSPTLSVAAAQLRQQLSRFPLRAPRNR